MIGVRRAVVPVSALVAVAALLTGCAHQQALTLTGPRTGVSVDIPDGWHQVINSANPVIPEMVTPTSCSGANEVACSTGLARTATITAKSAEEAVDIVRKSVLADPRITELADVSKGPGKVGAHDGYLNRFTFRNPKAKLTCEVAALQTGPNPPAPPPGGAAASTEYSVVLVWVTDSPDAPKADVIDQIVGSVRPGR